MPARTTALAALLVALALLGCASHTEAPRESARAPVSAAGVEYVVPDTTIDDFLEAPGVAEPLLQATLSTRLMGSVTEVLVREGDAVHEGQVLVRIDARDLTAKAAQVNAAIAEAEAVHRDAQVQAARIRALYADSAATRAQLDGAETALVRTESAVRTAHASAQELEALTGYATVTAPFAGVVTQRLVDPGAFAAPGTPLVTVQSASRLRLTASASPPAVRAVKRGMRIAATVEDVAVHAIVEGVVPAPTGNVYTVNAIVENRDGAMMPGSAATLLLPQGRRRAVLVPDEAVRREGDLTGVIVRTEAGDLTRWVRLGAVHGLLVEVLSGLTAGDRIVVPESPARGVAAAPPGGR